MAADFTAFDKPIVVPSAFYPMVVLTVIWLLAFSMLTAHGIKYKYPSWHQSFQTSINAYYDSYALKQRESSPTFNLNRITPTPTQTDSKQVNSGSIHTTTQKAIYPPTATPTTKPVPTPTTDFWAEVDARNAERKAQWDAEQAERQAAWEAKVAADQAEWEANVEANKAERDAAWQLTVTQSQKEYQQRVDEMLGRTSE